MEKESKILQSLESAVFNEFRRDVRKRLSRPRNNGRSRVGLSRRGASDRHAVMAERKVRSEQVRGSRIRSRVKPRFHTDLNEQDIENEMVEMNSQLPASEENVFFLNTTDIPILTGLADEPDGLAGSKRSLSPSSSLPDVRGALSKPRTDDLAAEDPLPLRSTPYHDNEVPGPRVTFSCSGGDMQDQSGTSQKNVLQPNLDFELDVTFEIDSGKCVLHPVGDGDKEDVPDVR